MTAPADLFVRLVDGDEFVSASLPVSEDGKARWVPSQTVPRVTGYVLFDVTGRELLRHTFVQPGAGYPPGWPVTIHQLRPDIGPTQDANIGWKIRPTSTVQPEVYEIPARVALAWARWFDRMHPASHDVGEPATRAELELRRTIGPIL